MSWGPSNPLWRYLQAKKAKSKKNIKVRVQKERMAKRRGRRSGRAGKKSRSYSRGSGIKDTLTSAISAAVYGVVRPKISAAINSSPRIGQNSFLGNYANEVVAGGSAFLLDKFVNNHTLSAAMKPVQFIEIASAAEQASRDMTKGPTGFSGTNVDG